ncbi:transmembrane protein 231-like [Liolophura sinensis]|uniref:transmembrane protein 231-like n=1 Tax=Liolophura sinensis TaxID=3198878 RepID=UPI0031599063
MAVYQVFSHPELRRYKTHVCTKATVLQFLIVLLTFIPPLFVVYRSTGFWQREAYFREVPSITFKKQLLMVLELRNGQYVTWSTYQNYNQLQQEHLRIPAIKTREEDSNSDGKFDKLILRLEVPLSSDEEVQGVHLLLMFRYKLQKFTTLTMESMAYLHYQSAAAGSEMWMVGDIRFKQKQPIGHKGIDNRYNISVIDSSSIYAEDFKLTKIFQSYSDRNLATVVDNSYYVWTAGRGADQPFVISANINYLEDVYLYTPGFWYLIKWGWVQYVAVLLIFLFAFDRIKIFIFQNQLVNTMVDSTTKHVNKSL